MFFKVINIFGEMINVANYCSHGIMAAYFKINITIKLSAIRSKKEMI